MPLHLPPSNEVNRFRGGFTPHREDQNVNAMHANAYLLRLFLGLDSEQRATVLGTIGEMELKKVKMAAVRTKLALSDGGWV